MTFAFAPPHRGAKIAPALKKRPILEKAQTGRKTGQLAAILEDHAARALVFLEVLHIVCGGKAEHERHQRFRYEASSASVAQR